MGVYRFTITSRMNFVYFFFHYGKIFGNVTTIFEVVMAA